MAALSSALSLCAALVRGVGISRPAVGRVPSLLMHSDIAKPPRLMLLSSGLTTPHLEATFRGLLHEAAAGSKPCITMVVTGQMTPSNEAGAKASRASRLALHMHNFALHVHSPLHACPLLGADLPDEASDRKPKSAGEKRRRRWYEARKKGRLLGERLGVDVHCVDCAHTQAGH